MDEWMRVDSNRLEGGQMSRGWLTKDGDPTHENGWCV